MWSVPRCYKKGTRLELSQFSTAVCEERTWAGGRGRANVGDVTRKRLVTDCMYVCMYVCYVFCPSHPPRLNHLIQHYKNRTNYEYFYYTFCIYIYVDKVWLRTAPSIQTSGNHAQAVSVAMRSGCSFRADKEAVARSLPLTSIYSQGQNA
jgi:hypothetical protein